MGFSFKKPIITRGGNPVKIYQIYENEIHGAYESNNKWYIASWRLNGYFHPPDKKGKQFIATLDLINDEPEDLGRAA
jgi:hypothetical protein